MSPPTFPQDPPAYFSDQVLPSSDGVGGLEGRVGLGHSHVQRPHLLGQKGTLGHTWIALADDDSVFIPRRKALIPVAQYLVETDKQTHRHTDTHRDNSNSNSKTLFYKDCSLGSERVSKEESWCFTPSQQVRLYQGDRETETRV